MKKSEKVIADSILYAFWDIDKSKLNFSKDADFIISRMFERGKLDDLLNVISFYGKKESIKAVTHNKYLSRTGLYLAHVLLGIPLVDFSAYALPKYD